MRDLINIMEVYILHSKVLQKHYIGFSKKVSTRLIQHRKEKKHWTSRADDWALVWKQPVSSTEEARTLEKKIKLRGAKRFLIDIGGKSSNAD